MLSFCTIQVERPRVRFDGCRTLQHDWPLSVSAQSHEIWPKTTRQEQIISRAEKAGVFFREAKQGIPPKIDDLLGAKERIDKPLNLKAA